MMENELQMQIKFKEHNNRFRSALGRGDFIFLAECLVPGEEREISGAAERLMPFAEKMWSFDDLNGGLAVPDRFDSLWSAADLATVLPEEKRNRNIFFLSGSGRNSDNCRNELTIAANCGAANIVPVSGNMAPFSVSECRNRIFTGSAEILDMLHRKDGFFPGAAFNPYCYTEAASFACYANLEQKISSGAEFITVQAGWDMLQLQALRWYMLKRKIYNPLIARLIMLSPEKVERISAGKEPGLNLSPDLLKMLNRELCGSRAQFEAAQYRRLEIQAAGCRLLGFSGIIVSGVDFPGTAEIVAERIRSAINEFSSFEQWLDEYNIHQAGAEMFPSRSSYRMYDRVLRRDYPFDEPPAENESDVRISRMERAGYLVNKFFFSGADRLPASRDRLLKKLLAGCSGCDECSLPRHDFVCIGACPKHLTHGPCGGLRSDGSCESGENECCFVKASRIARWRNLQNNLES